MAFIRLYKDTDFDACAHICIATLPPSLAASPTAAKLSPYLWTHPYTFLSPSTCHVLDDGTGKAVGYCIGCPDVYAFVAGYEKYISAILSRDVDKPAQLTTKEPWTVPVPAPIPTNTSTPTTTPTLTTPTTTTTIVNPQALAQNAYRADWMLLEGGEAKSAVTSRWRATMHIDLLPEWQRGGWGRRLIEKFVASVQASGQDYGEGEHIGVAGENSKVVPFYEKVGFRVVEGGENEGNIWMVRDIEKV